MNQDNKQFEVNDQEEGTKGDAPVAAPAPTPAAQAAPETHEQRMARLQAAADAIINKETDEEIVKRLVEEARQRKLDELLPKDSSGFPKDYVKVVIFKGREKNDLAYVPLGINGFVIKVPRGEEVILPKVFVTECLEGAIEEITVQSQGGLVTRPAHRFPYNVKGPATPDEYEAFKAAERAKAEKQTAAA